MARWCVDGIRDCLGKPRRAGWWTVVLAVFVAVCAGTAPAGEVLHLAAHPEGLDVPGRLLAIRAGNVPSDPRAWAALPDSAFRSLAGKGTWSGFRPGHVLLRLPVRSATESVWWVLPEYVDIDSIRAGAAGGASGWAGEDVPRSRWNTPWHAPWIPVRVKAGDDTIHVEVAEWTGRLGVSLRMQPDGIRQKSAEDLALRDGLFVGLLLANLFLACCLFALVRHLAHFWYLVYQAFVIVFVFSTHHHSFAWLWPSRPDLNQITPSFGSIGAFGALALFLSHLLDLPAAFPRLGRLQRWLGRILTTLALLQILIPVAPWVVDLCYAGPQMELLEIGSYLLGFALVAHLALRGSGLAIFAAIASLPMLLALGMSVGGELFHEPWMYAWRSLVVEVAMCCENTLFGLLLAHKIGMERRRQRELLERLLSVEREFNDRLVRETDRHLRGTALDLHDGVGQDLTALRIQAEMLGTGSPSCERFRTELERVAGNVRDAAHGLYPPELKGGDLNQALALMRERLSVGGGLEVQVEGRAQGLTEDDALQWYRIAQEAIQNARKHGRASRVRIRLEPRRMVIEDDGDGIRDGTDEGVVSRSIQIRAAHLGCVASVFAMEDGGCRVEVAPEV